MTNVNVEERRAPVQGRHLIPRMRTGAPGEAYGTVSWTEHEEAWRAYAKRYGTDQSAERIAERRGFGYAELTELLGHAPTTWRPL